MKLIGAANLQSPVIAKKLLPKCHRNARLGCVLTTPFTPARKPFRKGLLFTDKNRDFGANSMTERSCAEQISKLERHISERFCSTLSV